MLKWCRCGFESQKNHTVDVISIASVGVFRVLGWGLGGVGGGNMIPQRAAVWKRSRTGKRRFAANNFIGCCSGLVQSFFGVGLGSVAAQDVHCAGLRSAKQIYSSSPGIFFDPNNSAFLILFFLLIRLPMNMRKSSNIKLIKLRRLTWSSFKVFMNLFGKGQPCLPPKLPHTPWWGEKRTKMNLFNAR